MLASHVVHAHLISISTMLWRTNAGDTFMCSWQYSQGKLNSAQELEKKILAVFNIFGVFTQFKFYNWLRQEMFNQGDSSSR